MEAKDLITASPVFKRGFLIDSDVEKVFSNKLDQKANLTQLLLVTEGNGRFVIGNERYQLTPGTLLVNQQGVWGKEEIDSACRFKAMYVSFSSLQVEGLPENHLIGAAEPPVIQIGEGVTDYEQLMLQSIGERRGELAEAELFSNAYLSLLIGKLVRKLHHSPKGPEKRPSTAEESILAVKQLIEDRYRENWSLVLLGENVFLSPAHLCRQFKRKVGWSPGQYVIRCRVEAAKYSLIHSNETIGKIADQVGYQSETHFHQVFKKNTGITPGHYREIHRRGGSE